MTSIGTDLSIHTFAPAKAAAHKFRQHAEQLGQGGSHAHTPATCMPECESSDRSHPDITQSNQSVLFCLRIVSLWNYSIFMPVVFFLVYLQYVLVVLDSLSESNLSNGDVNSK